MSSATLTPPKPMASSVRLVTVEEYAALRDDGRYTELIRGRIVEMPSPKPAHGFVCANVSFQFNVLTRSRKLGRVIGNDSGVITERDPDSMRGPDVAYYSYSRVPEGPVPANYWPAPELAFEVMSEHDRWSEMNAKAGEYLAAGVVIVCVLDPGEAVLAVYRANKSPIRLGRDESFSAPELFGDWSVPVREFLD